MESSLTLNLMFIGLPVILVLVGSLLARSKKFLLGCIVLLSATGILAGSGILTDFHSLPPRLPLVLAPLTVVVAFFAFRPIGTVFRDLPLSWLIGFQAFRLPLELMIHRAVEEGVAPPQFTWTGLNFDIVVGILSLCLAPLASKLPKWIIWVWNVIGISLLLNVVTVAAISVPGPLQLLTPDNTWIAYFPFIWLPTICVMAALFGHLVTTRKLLSKNATRP